ncbi:MAG: hypothetical protein HQL66_04440 [Magnetococcales bacterium]|nr:hypothetical protein [Magnetococcales bacterium]
MRNTLASELMLAWRLLRADLRDGALFVGSVLLGVWILVGAVLTGGALRAQVDAETHALLAADLRVEGNTPFTDWSTTHLERPGRIVAPSLEFEAMAQTETGKASQLVEVKAVTADYPLRGQVDLVGGGRLADALVGEGIVVDGELLDRLHLSIGDTLRLGEARFTIRARLAHEPDRVMRILALGPRVLIPLDRVPTTNLIRPGSRVQYVASLRLAAGENLQQLAAELESAANARSLRIVTPGKKQPTISRLIGRFTLFMGLVAVMALLVGGLAIAGSVAAYMGERTAIVAILKCLGAGNQAIVRIFLWQVLIMAGAGGIGGMLLGLATPGLLAFLLRGAIAISVTQALNPPLLLSALGLGLALTLLLSLGPVWRVRRTLPGALFRNPGWGDATMDTLRFGWPLFAVGALLVALATRVAGEPELALAFLGIVAVALPGIRLLVGGMFRLLRRWQPQSFAWRAVVRALLRPENHSLTSITVLSLGASLVATILLVQWDIARQIQVHLPGKVPGLFFADIQPDQKEPFQQSALTVTGQTEGLRLTPVVRGRLVGVRRVNVREIQGSNPVNTWRFTREYVLTWSATQPPNNPLIAGRWWDSPREEGVSVEEKMARDLELHLGDDLVFDIQGMRVTAPVRSIREVTWSDMGLNFFVVFSPPVLQGVPETWLASLVVPPEREEAMYQATVRAFPNVTVIRSRAIMDAMLGVLRNVARAVTVLGGMALISGLMVLWVAVAATRRRRVREGAIHRLLGATNRDIMRLATLEFVALGGVVALVSLIAAQAMSAAVMHLLLHDPWHRFPEVALLTALSTMGLIALTGWLAVRHELRAPPMIALFRSAGR